LHAATQSLQNYEFIGLIAEFLSKIGGKPFQDLATVRGLRVWAVPGKNFIEKFIMNKNACNFLMVLGCGNFWMAST
jgi:hypothetical protein